MGGDDLYQRDYDCRITSKLILRLVVYESTLVSLFGHDVPVNRQLLRNRGTSLVWRAFVMFSQFGQGYSVILLRPRDLNKRRTRGRCQAEEQHFRDTYLILELVPVIPLLHTFYYLRTRCLSRWGNFRFPLSSNPASSTLFAGSQSVLLHKGTRLTCRRPTSHQCR
jgi:hypothetical protein